MKRVTIADVARRAGVSLASASRALNGNVASAETVERVTAAARELGYRPSSRAQSLQSGQTRQLSFVMADIGNPVYVEMMRAIEAKVTAAGYRLVVTRAESASETVELVRDLERGYVDGMIVSPLRVSGELVEALRATSVPVVVIGRFDGSATIADTVMADSPAGVLLAIDHLCARGAQHITFVNGPADTTPGIMRQRGFDDAIAAHSLIAGDTVIADDFTIAAGYEAGRALFANDGDTHSPATTPRAILAANDLLAIGIMHAAREAGLELPRDLLVVGIDNTALTSVCSPPLTSIDLGSAERGRIAADLLLSRLEHEARAIRSVVVTPTLVERGSTVSSGAFAPKLTRLVPSPEKGVAA